MAIIQTIDFQGSFIISAILFCIIAFFNRDMVVEIINTVLKKKPKKTAKQ